MNSKQFDRTYETSVPIVTTSLAQCGCDLVDGPHVISREELDSCLKNHVEDIRLVVREELATDARLHEGQEQVSVSSLISEFILDSLLGSGYFGNRFCQRCKTKTNSSRFLRFGSVGGSHEPSFRTFSGLSRTHFLTPFLILGALIVALVRQRKERVA